MDWFISNLVAQDASVLSVLFMYIMCEGDGRTTSFWNKMFSHLFSKLKLSALYTPKLMMFKELLCFPR